MFFKFKKKCMNKQDFRIFHATTISVRNTFILTNLEWNAWLASAESGVTCWWRSVMSITWKLARIFISNVQVLTIRQGVGSNEAALPLAAIRCGFASTSIRVLRIYLFIYLFCVCSFEYSHSLFKKNIELSFLVFSCILAITDLNFCRLYGSNGGWLG